MENTYWQKQTQNKPLFPDILWNRPENRSFAGKLLLIGGNLGAINAVSQAFTAAEKAGIGSVRVLLPEAVQKTFAALIPEAEFAPSALSGSFSRKALDTVIESSSWADGVLLAGDFGKNSETAVMLDSYIRKYKSFLGISGDGLDYFFTQANTLLKRPKTVICAEFSKLQKIISGKVVIKNSMNLHNLVQVLHEWSTAVEAIIVTTHNDQIIVVYKGQISTTPIEISTQKWIVGLAAHVTTWLLQQQGDPYKAVTTAVFNYLKD